MPDLKNWEKLDFAGFYVDFKWGCMQIDVFWTKVISMLLCFYASVKTKASENQNFGQFVITNIAIFG